MYFFYLEFKSLIIYYQIIFQVQRELISLFQLLNKTIPTRKTK
jgi:hypothetical protein